MIEMLSTVGLVAMVAAAAWTDLRTRRIPNVITISGLAVGLALQSFAGPAAVWGALLGAGIALALSLPLFMLGALGGGDGKLLMAVGAFLGPDRLATALLVTGIAGGVLALVEVTRRKALLPTLLNVHGMLTARPGGGSMTIATPGSITVPYGLAIAVGALVGWFA